MFLFSMHDQFTVDNFFFLKPCLSLFSRSDSAEGMKAGNYGNLLVLIEQPRGEYAVTVAFLRLVTTLVKVARIII